MHGDTKRTEEKPARKINGRGGGGGEKMEEERTIYHRASYLHHQDDHAYGSQHVLVVVQPFLHFLKAALKKKKKRNGTKGGVRMPAKKSTLCECGRGIASPFPVHAFSRIMHLLHMRYTLGWMNYQVSKWITHERCHLYADLWAVWGGVCTLTLNCISS